MKTLKTVWHLLLSSGRKESKMGGRNPPYGKYVAAIAAKLAK
jgi:hypothetical protein